MSVKLASLLFFLVGSSLAVAGIHTLFGTGWALVAGSVPCIVVSLALARGSKP